MDAFPQVKTIDRLVRLLDCFTPKQPSWSLAELAAQLDLPKSTLHRFLVGLEAHGILRRDPADKRWRLSYRLFVWGSVAAGNNALREIARPILRELAAASGEAALLTIYQDREVICIDRVETHQAVRLALDVGARRGAHAGASSKVLMAHLAPDEVRAIIREKGLPKLCANTITDVKKLEAELARIRKVGYAQSLEETDPGVWGVATPIWDWTGQVAGAIGLAGPTLRYDEPRVKQYVSMCCRSAEQISVLLRGQCQG